MLYQPLRIGDNNMTKQELITHLNMLRKTYKNNWFTFTGTYEDKSIEVKCYNTWLQIVRVNGLNVSNSLMDISVKQFNTELNNIL